MVETKIECFYEMSIKVTNTNSNEFNTVLKLIKMGIPCKVYFPDFGGNFFVYEFSFHEKRKSIIDEIVSNF